VFWLQPGYFLVLHILKNIGLQRQHRVQSPPVLLESGEYLSSEGGTTVVKVPICIRIVVMVVLSADQL
jgi:hypothetical protein